MNKTFLALGVVGVLTYSVPTMPAKAFSNPNTKTISTENQTRTAGLIHQYNVSVLSSNGKLVIDGYTRCTNTMKSIGYKSISIEYSTDNANWKEEKYIGDLLKSSNSYYYLNDYSVSVKGGYYYRVSLTHYAKESGLFGSSQSVPNTSNSVWID
mgnify:FL=1